LFWKNDGLGVGDEPVGFEGRDEGEGPATAVLFDE
jgi:hypothetical protein